MIHTGIRSRSPWQTLSLLPGQEDPPDWVVMDLMASGYPMPRAQWNAARSLPDTWSALSYLNSTAGKVNINNRIYPSGSSLFEPPHRTLTTEAVFKHLRSQDEIESLSKAMLNYQDDDQVFDYVGELAEVEGYEQGATDWEKESLLRNMAGALTTQSNTFGVWGIAQTVRKDPFNKDFGQFEWGDGVMGERRFYALVERHVWPGKDGVPGNGHTNSRGHWDRLAKADPNAAPPQVAGNQDDLYVPGSPPRPAGPGGSFAEMDGPTAVDMEYGETLPKVIHSRSSLADAYNPADAVMKYRILYFKYLDH